VGTVKLREGLRGMTSNPTIFDKAISKSTDYDEDIRALVSKGLSVEDIYKLALKDVVAADEMRKVYEETNGLDGYISTK
jgi:transaldolase